MQTRLFTHLDRRTFLQGSALVIATSGLTERIMAEDAVATPKLRIGLLTDMHYADKDPAGTRHYRETLAKLEEAGKAFAQHKPNFVVELGDFIDAAADVETEQRYLKTIQKEFSQVADGRHYVLGNHCVDTLTKEEFLGGVGQEKSYYSFDHAGHHFIVLDSCFRSDGTPYQRKNFTWTDPNIPAEELEWLKGDLAANDRPTIVFAHQRLDVSNSHGVKNAPAVREALEQSGHVKLVFQGHSHKNDLKEIGGIHYCTLVAMVEGSGLESSGYSLLDLHEDGSLRLEGFRKQENRRWE